MIAHVRPARVPADVEAAHAVWAAAETARRGFAPAEERAARSRKAMADPANGFVVAEDEAGAIAAIGVGMQAREQDGLGDPIPDLWHIAMVFVAPERWGLGLGGAIVEALMAEGRARGYARTQLWTHLDNARARALYVRLGFTASGREKEEGGEPIMLFQRPL